MWSADGGKGVGSVMIMPSQRARAHIMSTPLNGVDHLSMKGLVNLVVPCGVSLLKGTMVSKSQQIMRDHECRCLHSPECIQLLAPLNFHSTPINLCCTSTDSSGMVSSHLT